MNPKDRLRHHVTGAIERGEKPAIVEQRPRVRVAFRVDRNGDPASVTAVFPDEPASSGMMVCYAHIGQHSECSRTWYQSTRPAAPAVYASLLRELKYVYAPDTLRVVKRIRRQT